MKPSAPAGLPVMAATPGRIAGLLASLIVIVVLCSVHFSGELGFVSLEERTDALPVDIRILVGVLTLADRYEVRHLHRLLHSLEPPTPGAIVDIRFVLCRLTKDEQRVLVSLEQLLYGDIILLDCPRENMNSGKTYHFFSTVARAFNSTPYDYVMKSDDDTYLRVPQLVESLRPLPRRDLYYGNMHLPANAEKDPEGIFMCGMGYALSWDLVQHVAASEFARNNTIGLEDKQVAKWLRHGGLGRNVHDTRPSDTQVAEWFSGGDRVIDTKLAQYDLPVPPRRFLPRAVSVHRLKDRAKWAQVIKYFNVTAGLDKNWMQPWIAAVSGSNGTQRR